MLAELGVNELARGFVGSTKSPGISGGARKYSLLLLVAAVVVSISKAVKLSWYSYPQLVFRSPWLEIDMFLGGIGWYWFSGNGVWVLFEEWVDGVVGCGLWGGGKGDCGLVCIRWCVVGLLRLLLGMVDGYDCLMRQGVGFVQRLCDWASVMSV